MQTEQNQSSSESLFDTTAKSESLTEAESNTQSGEEIDTKDVSAENRQKQINTWERRLESGETTEDKVPGWVLKALRTAEPKGSEEERFKKLLKADKEATAFEALKSKVNDAGLSEAKQKELDAEFKDLKESGLSEAKALEKAIKITGITFEDSTRFSARIPRPSTKKLSSDEEFENQMKEGKVPENMSVGEQVAALERLRKQGGGR